MKSQRSSIPGQLSDSSLAQYRRGIGKHRAAMLLMVMKAGNIKIYIQICIKYSKILVKHEIIVDKLAKTDLGRE